LSTQRDHAERLEHSAEALGGTAFRQIRAAMRLAAAHIRELRGELSAARERNERLVRRLRDLGIRA
jgi:hypothetical protein